MSMDSPSGLMLVHVVDFDGMASLETEYDPPVGARRHRPEARVIAFQPMGEESGQVHVLGRNGCIQSREDIPHGLAMIDADVAFVGALEKPSRRPASESLYREDMQCD